MVSEVANGRERLHYRFQLKKMFQVREVTSQILPSRALAGVGYIATRRSLLHTQTCWGGNNEKSLFLSPSLLSLSFDRRYSSMFEGMIPRKEETTEKEQRRNFKKNVFAYGRGAGIGYKNKGSDCSLAPKQAIHRS